MPYGVTMAGALGARVIKLEGATGDPMRSAFGAADVGGEKTMQGKESLAVDLQTPEGRKIVQEAVATADMFVNGFRSGVAERMGLDYATVVEAQPAPRVRARGGLRHRRPARPPPDLRAGRAGGRREASGATAGVGSTPSSRRP